MRRINALEDTIVGGYSFGSAIGISPAQYGLAPWLYACHLTNHLYYAVISAGDLLIYKIDDTGALSASGSVTLTYFTGSGVLPISGIACDGSGDIHISVVEGFFIPIVASVYKFDSSCSFVARTQKEVLTGATAKRGTTVFYADISGDLYGMSGPADTTRVLARLDSSYDPVATFGSNGVGVGKYAANPGLGDYSAVVSDDGYVKLITSSKNIIWDSAAGFYDESTTSSVPSHSGNYFWGSDRTLYDKDGAIQYSVIGPSYGKIRGGPMNGVDYFGAISDMYPVVFSGSVTQTTFSLYTRNGTPVSLGTPDAGVSVPSPYALSDYPAWLHPQHIVDMRTAIQAMASYFNNPATGNPYNFTDGSADNLYYVAMGDRRAYGGSRGPRYTWTRTGLEMLGTPTYDIDIGEIHECVRQLEAS